MKMQCPQCGVVGSVDDSYVGRKIRCPKCKEMFQADENAALVADEVIDTPKEILADVAEQDLESQVETAQADTLPEEEPEKDIQAEQQVQEAVVDEPAEDSAPEDEVVVEEMVEPAEAVVDDLDDLNMESADAMTDVASEVNPVPAVTCMVCGKYTDDDEEFMELDGLPYCQQCGQHRQDELSISALAATAIAGGTAANALDDDDTSPFLSEQEEVQPVKFTMGEALKEAWNLTRGVKGPIWGGMLVAYGLILAAFFAVALLATMTGESEGGVVAVVLELVMSAFSALLTGGLMYMGVKRGLGRRVVWKDVFSGFKVSGKIIVAAILQMLLITLGCLLLLLPGIYLFFGYMMTMPLIIDKKMSPWQAMETSRKAIHKVWWKIFGLYFVVGLIVTISAIPLGIGLIWTLPLSVVLVGVVYRYLFVAKKKAD